ncbi:MAG TPA: alpha/beta fold hydrolase [Symbiobacteriaceae bacterium]
MRKILGLVLLLAAVLMSQYLVLRANKDVVVTREMVAGNPVDVYAAVGEPRGTVVAVHGFAGNKEAMRPWGYALARQGFDTYVMDQPGHGESQQPLPPWQDPDNTALGENVRAVVDELIATGRAQPGKIALIGHSMGASAVLQAATGDSRVRATVAISGVGTAPDPANRPANLLMLAAQLDPAMIREWVRQAAARAGGGDGQMGVLYGDFAAGTAWEADLVPARGHLTILYDVTVVARAAHWIHSSFGSGAAAADAQMPVSPWTFGGLAAGVTALVLTGGLVAVKRRSRWQMAGPRIGLGTATIALAVAGLAAALACVYLRIPGLRVATVDYLVPYFLVMTAVLAILRVLWPADFGFSLWEEQSALSGIGRGVAVFLVYLIAIGTIIHFNFSRYILTGSRILPALLLAVSLWIYLLHEEGLKRAVASTSGKWAWPVTGLLAKAILVATWLGAGLLPNPPVYLILILPVAAGVMVLAELVSVVFGRWNLPPAAAATFSALVVAWSAGSLLPIV